jgi:DNA-binding winged helix-turn-helix (wHTH) protein
MLSAVPVPGDPAAPGAGGALRLRLRFGDWVFDGECRELRGPGGAAHLSPKAFELLGALLESRPRALSKAELHDRLWANTFVSESNLARLVKEIRRALRDPVRRPTYLRTVHGFGYAFCGDAIEAARDAAPAGSELSFCLAWGPREIPLDEGENVLGRGLDASARIGSATVSRRHARIVLAAGSATIEDLGSKNGTYLNGRRLTGPAPLADRDAIGLGELRLVFRVLSATGRTQTWAGRRSDA